MHKRLNRDELIRYGSGVWAKDLSALSKEELEELAFRIDKTINWISGKREGLQQNLTPLWIYVSNLVVFVAGVVSFAYAVFDWAVNDLSKYGKISVALGVVATGGAMLLGLPRMIRQRPETVVALDQLAFELAWARRAGERIAREIHRALQLA